MYDLNVQVGFGLYPVVVKVFAEEEKADPIIFSFYRQVLISVSLVPSQATPRKSHSYEKKSGNGLGMRLGFCMSKAIKAMILFRSCVQRCLLLPSTVCLCLRCRPQTPHTQSKNAYCKFCACHEVYDVLASSLPYGCSIASCLYCWGCQECLVVR